MEDIETVPQTTEEATASESQGYSDILRGDGTTPEDSPSSEPKEETPAAGDDTEATTVDESDSRIALEIGGKTFTGSQSFLTKVMELTQALGDDAPSALEGAEKLAELKKNYDKGFTQKTQELATERKSLEEAFNGKVPPKEDLSNLGKLYQQYFTDEKVARAIDSILAGQFDQLGQGEPSTPTQPQTAETMALKKEIEGLKNQVRQFTSSIDQREQERTQREASKLWNSWVEGKKTTGVEINEDIDRKMAPFISALSQANPDWDNNKVLDTALRHATIDEQPKKIASKVINDAEKAKKTNPPKTTPKIPQKSDSEKSYAELFAEG